MVEQNNNYDTPAEKAIQTITQKAKRNANN